jgi:hypothetical protein
MFVIDYGLLWVSRHQAQNSADAGALAGATALALDNFNDHTATGPAKLAARSFALSNVVWDAAPDVQMASDVRFYSDAPAAFPATCVNDDCIRVDVYRNQARGNPLPMFLGFLVGLTDQGVRATATAQASTANGSECLKPWAIADKWAENNPVIGAPWSPTSTFDTTGTHPDVYTPPSANSTGTSFTLANDLGVKLTLKVGQPGDAINPGWFQAIDLSCEAGGGGGGSCYRNNISGCSGTLWKIGDDLPKENGNMVGPTKQGVNDLVALDPNAQWDPGTKKVINSCVGPPYTCSNPGYTASPRIVAVPVFDLAEYLATGGPGNGTVHVVNILGFFVDKMQSNDVVGYLTTMPDVKVTNGGTVSQASAFIKAIQLVR